MTSTADAKRLQLTVANFGPIGSAHIDLRPLTVFVGPSNTGKSYLAALIYALHRFFSGYADNVAYPRTGGEPNDRLQLIPSWEYDITDGQLEEIHAWAAQGRPWSSSARRSAPSQIDLDSATFPAGFGLVTESLYNRWVEIATRIQEG